MLKEIPITALDVRIGNAENKEAGTGCTVIIRESGMCAGLDVRGGGPASRESELLKPVAAAQSIHAALLSGGSAFGLDAAGGVQQYLEERGVGFDVGVTKVPLVCQSCLFDLTVARADVRPDRAMGYAACQNAEAGNYRDGSFGAGTRLVGFLALALTLGDDGVQHLVRGRLGVHGSLEQVAVHILVIQQVPGDKVHMPR